MAWHSKLHTEEVALSGTEAEYVAVSKSLRDAIPIQDRGFQVPMPMPIIHCRLFEDNSGALEL
jgi:hypothetical protein